MNWREKQLDQLLWEIFPSWKFYLLILPKKQMLFDENLVEKPYAIHPTTLFLLLFLFLKLEEHTNKSTSIMPKLSSRHYLNWRIRNSSSIKRWNTVFKSALTLPGDILRKYSFRCWSFFFMNKGLVCLFICLFFVLWYINLRLFW